MCCTAAVQGGFLLTNSFTALEDIGSVSVCASLAEAVERDVAMNLTTLTNGTAQGWTSCNAIMYYN